MRKIIYYKIHGTGKKTVLAAADEDIIGKTFKEKEIEFTVSESFYKGQKISKEKFKEILKNYNNINLAGKETIEIALTNKIIKKENILIIENMPHAQFYFI